MAADPGFPAGIPDKYPDPSPERLSRIWFYLVVVGAVGFVVASVLFTSLMH